MASGVTANSKCLDEYQSLKLKKTHRYIIFNLNKENTEIVVEKTSGAVTGDLVDQYNDFIGNFPETECRWAVYDFEFEKEGAGKRNKLIFYSWSPDAAKIKQKMVFASSKDALRSSLVGIHTEIQGTDFSEVSFETVLEKASRGA